MADMDLEDLVQGKLPNIQVPTQVKNKHFYQISYLDQQASVETSFSIEYDPHLLLSPPSFTSFPHLLLSPPSP